MTNKKKWLPGILVMTGIALLGGSASAANIEKDHLAFAKCDQDINIRTNANTDSTIVGKLRDKNAVDVLEIIDDEWCMIASGNVVGYMKSKHLVAGEEAWKIADEVGYQVAIVQASELNVRAEANDESNIIDVVNKNQEVEVVDYNGGAWMKVAMAADSIGYIDASYCTTKTYYPVAELLSTEALNEVVYPHSYSVPEVSQDSYEEPAYEEPAYEEPAYEEPAYEEPAYEEPRYEESYQPESYEEESYSEESYSEDAYNEENYNEESYNEQTYHEDSYEEPYYGEESYSNESYNEESYEEPYYGEESYTDGSYEEPYYGETSDGYSDSYDYGYEEPYTEQSGAGQSIVDYALQFVGNPYVYGGNSLTNGTDCSGFTQSVMSNFGIDLARVAADQAYGGQSVDVSDIQAGDLLFYSDGGGISHVGIYMGDGQIVHAATEDKGIIVSDYDYSTPVSAARYW